MQLYTLKNDRFIVTCYDDVKNWVNDIGQQEVYNNGGPYFYHLLIGTPGGEKVRWDMPHGDMLFETRLWMRIDMHEAFYEPA